MPNSLNPTLAAEPFARLLLLLLLLLPLGYADDDVRRGAGVARRRPRLLRRGSCRIDENIITLQQRLRHFIWSHSLLSMSEPARTWHLITSETEEIGRFGGVHDANGEISVLNPVRRGVQEHV